MSLADTLHSRYVEFMYMTSLFLSSGLLLGSLRLVLMYSVLYLFCLTFLLPTDVPNSNLKLVQMGNRAPLHCQKAGQRDPHRAAALLPSNRTFPS